MDNNFFAFFIFIICWSTLRENVAAATDGHLPDEWWNQPTLEDINKLLENVPEYIRNSELVPPPGSSIAPASSAAPDQELPDHWWTAGGWSDLGSTSHGTGNDQVDLLSFDFLNQHHCKCVDHSMCPSNFRSTMVTCADRDQVCCSNSRHYQSSCGRAASYITSHQGVKDSNIPWVASVLQEVTGGHLLLCSGTLIHPQVVLTAARCVFDYTADEHQKTIRVRLGDQDLLSDLEPAKYQQFEVTNITIHPEYDSVVKRNDVALLFLRRPTTPRQGVDTACVYRFAPPADSHCGVAAHGLDGEEVNSTSSSSLRLQQAPQFLLTHDQCQQTMRQIKYSDFVLDRSFVCTSAQSVCDKHNSQIGAPLTCVEAGTNRHRLVAFSSWGVGCSNQKPGVYTRIEPFFAWIDFTVTDFFGYIESNFGFNQQLGPMP